MNRLAQEAVVVGLAKRLADHGSWTGETHLQKAAYLLSELRGVDFDFDFILYKHGPFSFELRDELGTMQAEGLLRSHFPNPRYGPQLRVTSRGAQLEQSFAKTMHHYGPSLDWIVGELGNRGVMDLERLATAMWITRQSPGGTVADRAEAVTRIKPHISKDDAERAVEEVDRLLAAGAASPS